MSTVISILKMAIRAFLGFILVCCLISGTTADVPDAVVYTDLHQNAQLGSRAVLKCEFYGAPLAVYWKKGDNPSTAPNLITWVEGESDSGSCVIDKTCEMGDDYSLVIKNVSIADQGRYICRVSNYKGILLHNFTDVTVLAPPKEPYPIINECKADLRQKCILPATIPINITCAALKYFPNVDLFFLHGDQKYKTIDTLEWTDTDGTKSKSIFTTAPPSEIPYVCVAFNIPGSKEQRTTTVTVTGQSEVTTTPSSPPVIKIVVPITTVFCVAAGIILFFTICMIYWKRRRGRENMNDEEGMPMVSGKKKEGNISYYELWCLVRELHTALLRNTLRELKNADIEEDLSEQEGYEILCKWKDDNNSGNEAAILNKALVKVLKEEDYDRAMDNICENTKDASVKIYQHTFEHILLNVSDLDKIDEFLRELIPGRSTSVVNARVNTMDAMQSAIEELTAWSRGQLELNPLVLLSVALEKAECRTVARKFFLEKLPEQLESPIEPKAIKEIVQKLTGRHCKRLMRGNISNDGLRSIIAENNEFLFDTNAMIAHWLRNLECSDFEKRCRFDDALIKIGRYDLLDCFGTMSHRPLTVLFKAPLKSQQDLFDHDTIYDDDIPQLVKLIKCLPKDKMSGFNKKTGFSADRDDNILEEELKERRDNILTRSTSRKASSQEFRSLRSELTKHTENFDSTVTDEEIEVVASHVAAADKQQDLLRCLGFKVDAQQKPSFRDMVDQLKEWRKTQANRRKGLQDSLGQIGLGNEEIEDVASQITSTDKQQELLRHLGIKSGSTFAHQLKKWRDSPEKTNCREALYLSLRKIDSTLTNWEMEIVASQITLTDKQQELLRCLGIKTGAQQNVTFAHQLEKWRDTSKKTNCRETFHQSLRKIGFFDSTLTDEEIEVVASQITSTDKQQEVLGCLGIENDAQQFANQLKEWLNETRKETNCREAFYQSLRKIEFFDFTLADKEKENDATQVTSTDQIQAESTKSKTGRRLLYRFREWLRSEEKTNCLKVLQESLGVIGLCECIVSKSTKKLVYEVELSSIALNLLMEDVRPISEALAINRSTISSFIQPVSKQNKGTQRLVLELLRIYGTKRDDFCDILRCFGFADVSRSVCFDYEPSLSELIHIVDCVGNNNMDRFLKHLDLGSDDIEECRDSKGQIHKLKLMRLWKRQIRPVPYHYRLEIATALRDARLNEIANSVLSGEHRQKMPNPDVIKDIYSRLNDPMRNTLCRWLKENYGLREEAPTALVKWANRWMSEYRPTGILSRLLDHMEERKGMNDKLFSTGIHELAHEISALENSQLPVTSH